MPTWTDHRTAAHGDFGSAVQVVEKLLDFVKTGAGKPSAGERALFAAAVVFTYGIWENFVEQLAIEVTANLSKDVLPEKVPALVRQSLEKKSAWELSISPGWRALWSDMIKAKAVGDGDEQYGINAARSGKVKNLLMLAGVASPFEEVPDNIGPNHLPKDARKFESAIDELVDLRGGIVHTGNVPDYLRKSHVFAWMNFVSASVDAVDDACRKQCAELLAR